MFFITNVKIQFRNVMSIITYPKELEKIWIGEYGTKDKEKKRNQREKLENIQLILMEMLCLNIRVEEKDNASTRFLFRM